MLSRARLLQSVEGGLIETCGFAVHFLGVLVRCTCNLCSIIICGFQIIIIIT